MARLMKIVVFSPPENADAIREALAEAGAGVLGDYSHCTFSIRGITRFKPEEGADPAKGEIGKLAEVEEERIETLCEFDKVKGVIAAVKKVHPYEEPAIDIYPIEVVE